MRERTLPGFDDAAPPGRYCDLVLTGGITSAIAYPPLTHALAQAYRFNSIGGSSSGAGSAALAAAAEYRRRHGSADGYRTLLQRTAEVADDFQGRTGLQWLFQPDPGSQRLFRALLPAFAGAGRSGGAFVRNLLCTYKVPMLTGLALGLGVAWLIGAVTDTADPFGWGAAGVLAGLVLAVILLVSGIVGDLARAADADFGLCSGAFRAADAPHPPLTEWLHRLIQDIAGLPPGRPLTFADLHAAPGGPRETLGDMSPAGAKSIDLRMFTANVSLGQPLLLPMGEDDDTLYFRPAEMRRLFPQAVVDCMVASAKKAQAKAPAAPANAPPALEPRRSAGAPAPQDPAENEFLPLPRDELPIVVASRMSVSFPLLFSAVPLWQRDPSGTRMRRMLFADGGICSNFPIHLFDAPIPAWPTFGVALHETGQAASLDPERIAAAVHVPRWHREPAHDRWNDFDQAPRPFGRMLGFAGALLSTTKDWNDALLASLPGVRERVAQVGLPRDIGGLNILMTAEQIECLALHGGEAARRLLARYSTPSGAGGNAPGWMEHRWVRFNVLADCLHETLIGLARAAEHARHAQPLREQIRRAVDEAPLAEPGGRPLEPAQAAALERTLDALLQVERALTPRVFAQPYRPVPRPQLRIRPPM